MEKIMITIVATDIRGCFIPSDRLSKLLPDIESYVRSLSGNYCRVMSGSIFDKFEIKNIFSKLLVIGPSERIIANNSRSAERFDNLDTAYDSSDSPLYFVSACADTINEAVSKSGYVIHIRLNQTYRAFSTLFELEGDKWTRTIAQGRYSNASDIGYRIEVYKERSIDDVLPPDFWRAQSSAMLSKAVKEPKEPKEPKQPKKVKSGVKHEKGLSKNERRVHAAIIDPSEHEESNYPETTDA